MAGGLEQLVFGEHHGELDVGGLQVQLVDCEQLGQLGQLFVVEKLVQLDVDPELVQLDVGTELVQLDEV